MKLVKALLIYASLLAVLGCDDMNSVHQKYLDTPEINYLSVPKEVNVHGGKGRIKLVWALSADPNVAFCRIYWNDRNKNLDYPIQRTEEVESCIIELEEGTYNLELVHMDSKKESLSLVKQVSGRSYGNNYAVSLVNRPLTMRVVESNLILQWSNVENCQGCNFTYIKGDGESMTIVVDATETETVITDYKPGSEYSYTTVYEPEKDAIDVIESLPKAGVLPI